MSNGVRGIRRGMRSEAGFTLTELLVTIMIVGVLAGIAVPQFLGQRNRAADADAKSDARNLVSLVSSCIATAGASADCDGQGSGDSLRSDGFTLGAGRGDVSVTAIGERSFRVTAVSQTETEGEAHTYTIRIEGGGATRSCTAGTGNTGGGCDSGTW